MSEKKGFHDAALCRPPEEDAERDVAGQPRQEDLLAFLAGQGDGRGAAYSEYMQISWSRRGRGEVEVRPPWR